MGENRPAHGGDRDRRTCQGIGEQPSVHGNLETEAHRGAAAGLDVDDGDIQRLIGAADHINDVGNALAGHRTELSGQRRLVIERPSHGLAAYEVDARLRALVAQVGHARLGSELGHGSMLEDAAGFGQERGERLWRDAVALHQRLAFGREQRQAQVAFSSPAHRDVLSQARG